MHRVIVFALLTLAFSLSAADKPKGKFGDSLKPFVENFKGRGALPDGSEPLSPANTVKNFKLAEGLAIQVAGMKQVLLMIAVVALDHFVAFPRLRSTQSG